MAMQQKTKPVVVKILRTIIWAVFAGCILAIPFYRFQQRLNVSLLLIGIVLMEVVVLALNHTRCPLTDIAARYTNERRDNFDIYLPLWLARYNKHILGTLFVFGVCYTLIVWVLL